MKIILIIVIYIISAVSVFACGCADPQNAVNGENQIKNKFNILDNKLNRKITDELNLIKSILTIEKNIKDKINDLSVFEIDSSVTKSNFDFELKKTINILNNFKVKGE
jgi:hypothetical protein